MLTIHPDHKGPQARLESIKLIVGKLKDTESDALTVFVTGGFNAHPKHELFDPVKICMADAHIHAPETGLTSMANGFGTERERKIIDYIFPRNASTVSYRTITGHYSILPYFRSLPDPENIRILICNHTPQ